MTLNNASANLSALHTPSFFTAAKVTHDAHLSPYPDSTDPRNNLYDIVIVGGGAAGIGIAANLRRRQPKLRIAIIEPSDAHYYQPAWTLVGGGSFRTSDSIKPTATLIPQGVTWIKKNAIGFEPNNQRVLVNQGPAINYHYLVIATGLQLDWQAISGLPQALGKNGVTSNYCFHLAPYTWSLVKGLQSGRAIFTQPPAPIKCPGSPQKAMYLSCHHWETLKVIKNITIDFHSASTTLYSVPDFVPTLMSYVNRYHAALHFQSNLIAVDGTTKTAWFEVTDNDGKIQQIEKSFDLLHVVPPQKPQDCIKESPLANEQGWVDVDPYTLQHPRYRNIFSLGDACSTPNAKTMAAIRKQIVVVAKNLLAQRAGLQLDARYDGYGSCPLTVEKGKVVLAEFGFNGKLLPTFPSLIDPLSPNRLAWALKKIALPQLYWHIMLKGYEWLA